MGKKDINHQIIYRGKVLERFTTGGWVFFQRPKECCGGFGWAVSMRIVSGLSWISLFRCMTAWGF
ncbi:hypothetical protein NB931_003151 [Escherichia coli]|nr:hypothetical protein [Escherichia coli]EJH0097805.1 hypothetical protein [Escherichia coli]EJO0710973.1 hypothetical protein [Escherichia coli]